MGCWIIYSRSNLKQITVAVNDQVDITSTAEYIEKYEHCGVNKISGIFNQILSQLRYIKFR